MQYIKLNHSKLQVNDLCKKDEKTTITFEHSDVTNNIQSSPR